MSKLPYIEFREQLVAEKQKATYDKLSEKYEINKYYLWNMVASETYRPPAWVCVKLDIEYYVEVPACPDCGNGHAVGWCVEKYGEPAKPRTNSKPKKPRRPPWYALPDSQPSPERLERALRGWTD